MISDLLPADAIEGAVDRAYPLVLADYRVFLTEGMQELALVRKVKAQKMMLEAERKKGKEDPDYADDGHSAGSSKESVEGSEASEGLE